MKPSQALERVGQLEAEVARLREQLALQAASSGHIPSRRERLLRDAERVAHFGSWTWNLHSNEISWSDELYRILGLPAEIHPSAAAFFEAIHPEDRERVQTASRLSLENTTAEIIDFRIVRPNGERRQLHMEAAFVDGTDGPASMLVGTIVDQTDQQRAAALLAQAVFELNEAQRIASMGSWAWHLAEDRVEWSEGMYRLLGLDGTEVPSQELFFRHVYADDIERVREASERALATHTPGQLSLRMVRKDGKVRDAIMRSRAVLGVDDKLAGFYGVIQDVSEVKLLEDAARHAQKMEAIGTLAGGVAHDFNNYLMVLGGHVELLSISLPESHPGQRSLAAIEYAYERCSSLTQQLLTLSRKRPPQLRSFDLAEQIEKLSPMLRSALGATIVLKLELEQCAPLVCADPAQIEHALMNLALNARDGMVAGGTLTLKLETVCVDQRPGSELAAGAYLRLSVSDTGCGIPGELLSRIFEPFFTTKAVGKGTGLGLAVVYGIVRDAGGSIEVESRLGQGTTFHLYLRPAESSALDPQREPVAEASAGGGQRILLVEDVELVRELLRSQLVQAGYEVLVAADGVAALSVLARHRVDAVLSDVVMPNMGGLELVRTLREQKPQLPCLLMSGYSELTISDARQELAVALLRKPFTSRELRAALAELLRDRPRRGSVRPGSR